MNTKIICPSKNPATMEFFLLFRNIASFAGDVTGFFRCGLPESQARRASTPCPASLQVPFLVPLGAGYIVIFNIYIYNWG